MPTDAEIHVTSHAVRRFRERGEKSNLLAGPKAIRRVLSKSRLLKTKEATGRRAHQKAGWKYLLNRELGLIFVTKNDGERTVVITCIDPEE